MRRTLGVRITHDAASRMQRARKHFAPMRQVLRAGLCFIPATPAFAGDFTITAANPIMLCIVSGVVALAIAASLWALAQQIITHRLKRRLHLARARERAQIGARDALLATAKEALIVWGRDGKPPHSFGGAEETLNACLRGSDATELSAALDALSDKGTAFQMQVHNDQHRRVHMRGQAVGSMAVVWIETEPLPSSGTLDYRHVLNVLPMPVWVRDRALKLIWGNAAFLRAVEAPDLTDACREQVALEKTERDLAADAQIETRPVEARRSAMLSGTRRDMHLCEIPLDIGIVGTASDVTELAESEARLRQQIEAHNDTLDRLATAVAIFDSTGRLTFYNRAYLRLFELPESWLDDQPRNEEILDRLREERKLPEQRDFQSWKENILACFGAPRDKTEDGIFEDLWHTPDGKNLRAIAQPDPFGGTIVLFEDVTERITLESSINTLGRVQSATLNNLREGVAVFGPDGRLKLYNSAFAEIWGLTEADLAGDPHIHDIAGFCAGKFATETLWEQLVQAVVSDEGSQNDFGEIERSDRSILSLRLSPLPDGATLATFADVTARFRIEGILRERAEALEAADRLKSDFIRHVSYELRTPLNTILGFSEHIMSEIPGELNDKQREYMQAVMSASNALKDLVNDILDLALVESGALRLELKRIELTRFLSDIAQHAREWAAKAGLNLDLDLPDLPGEFLADERRISQVIYNLLSNALKYTPKGGSITLGGTIVGEDVQLFVQDNGPGIDPEVEANVFERFAAKGTRETRGGAGLGLALVNRFIELHDGWVEIENNGGTQVRCHLPRRLHDGSAQDLIAPQTPAE